MLSCKVYLTQNIRLKDFWSSGTFFLNFEAQTDLVSEQLKQDFLFSAFYFLTRVRS